MPQIKKVKLLQVSCLEIIATNIDKWGKTHVETYGDPKVHNHHHCNANGPFDSLPSVILEKIIGVLVGKELLTIERLEMLITSNLRTLCFSWLDLSRRDKDEHDTKCVDILNQTSVICPQLASLELCGTLFYSALRPVKPIIQLPKILPMFRNLQELNISYTIGGDDCFKILGVYCKELRVLKARECPVTDDGIKGLCVSVDDFGKANTGLGQCKSIQTLDVFGINITNKGVQMIIENLPDLKIFICDYQIQVLAELLRGPSPKNLRCVPNLTSLHNNGFGRLTSICQRGDIELVAANCSSVNKVHIHGRYIANGPIATDATLLELVKLKRLCEFRIQGVFSENELTFSGGILPLLKHFGNSLTSLCFANIYTIINVRAIVEHCPKLQTLTISNTQIHSSERLEDEPNPLKRMKTAPVLKNLKTLKLTYCRDLTSKDLDLLLASPTLEKLSLRTFNRLSIDNSLRKAANLHQFRHLERLKFCGVDSSVAKAGIDVLMTDDNCLKVIVIRLCRSLKVADVDE